MEEITKPGDNQNIKTRRLILENKKKSSTKLRKIKLLKMQERTHNWPSSMDLYTWTYQCWSTSENLFTITLCGDKTQLYSFKYSYKIQIISTQVYDFKYS